MKSREESSSQGGRNVQKSWDPHCRGSSGRRALVRRMGEMPDASLRVLMSEKGQKICMVVSWYYLDKTMGFGQWQGGALVHGLWRERG